MAKKSELSYVIRCNGQDNAQFRRMLDACEYLMHKRETTRGLIWELLIDGKFPVSEEAIQFCIK